jgi:pilus assembly protein Flp/PilA
LFGQLAKSRSGVTAIEYGLIAASVALAFLAIVVLLGDDIGGMFSTISNSVNNAASGS